MAQVCDRYASISPFNFGRLTIMQLKILLSHMEDEPLPYVAACDPPKLKPRQKKHRR